MQASSPLSSPLGMVGLRYTVKVSVCMGGGRSVRAQPDNVSAGTHPKKMSSCRTQANKHMQTNRNISHQLTHLPVSYFKNRNMSESWKKNLRLLNNQAAGLSGTHLWPKVEGLTLKEEIRNSPSQLRRFSLFLLPPPHQ